MLGFILFVVVCILSYVIAIPRPRKTVQGRIPPSWAKIEKLYHTGTIRPR